MKIHPTIRTLLSVSALMFCVQAAHADELLTESQAPYDPPVSALDQAMNTLPVDSTDPSGLSTETIATASAAADGLSTIVALNSGNAVEGNGFAPSGTAGIVGMTIIKMSVPYLTRGLPATNRRVILQATSAIYGGAAVNNLYLAAGATGPVGIVLAVCFGVYQWIHIGIKFDREEADRLNNVKE